MTQLKQISGDSGRRTLKARASIRPMVSAVQSLPPGATQNMSRSLDFAADRYEVDPLAATIPNREKRK
jgi:hypothetical protein